MNSRQKATLYHELGKLLGAGVNLDRSTDILLDQSPPAAVRRYLQGWRRGLAEHLTVAGALAKHCKSFVSPLEIHLVEAGEKAGRLDEAFKNLASYFELQQRARGKIQRALIYPLLLLSAGLLFPEMSKISSGVEAMFSGSIGRLLIGWVVIAFLAVCWLAVANASKTSRLLDGVLRSIPLIGPLRRHWAMARFCQSMEMGLIAALKMSNAVRLGGSASESALLDAASKRTAQEIESTGQALSLCLRKAGTFPRSFVNAMETAEVSGTLDLETERYAKIEVELASSSLDRVAEWMPRIAYGLVVIYVAFRIIDGFASIYGPHGLYRSLLDSN